MTFARSWTRSCTWTAPGCSGATCRTTPRPGRRSVYGYFGKWQKDGVFTQLNGLLRELVRQKEGRNASPSACVIDAQSVKTSTSGPASSQGTDAGKKIVGRKRSIVTDTIGLLLAVLVTAASVQDTVARHPAARPGRCRPPHDPQGLGRRRLPQALHRTCRHPRHRPGGHRPRPRGQGVHPRNGGRSSGPTAGSCSTAAWPATTKPCPPAPKP
ncbi:transposase [Streptomyces sp. NPDC012466]|uniref:transposase n=1 Tax=Streptomyces sp. NPDC012466 TaxID=3364835 RepID=UPI0036E8927B